VYKKSGNYVIRITPPPPQSPPITSHITPIYIVQSPITLEKKLFLEKICYASLLYGTLCIATLCYTTLRQATLLYVTLLYAALHYSTRTTLL
jgi:hypothetical protein